MMPGMEVIKMFFRQADGWISRSTTLNPIAWIILILIGSVFSSLYIGAPNWITITLVICVCASVILYIYAYIYFMKRNPDALRTEKYSIRKMEIERGFGDNITGQIEKSPIKGFLDIDAKTEKADENG